MEDYFGKWIKVLDRKELAVILNRLEEEYRIKSICPSQNEIFKAFKCCGYDDLKIVMLGQDPYPQKGITTGILFGNRKETPEESLSPSLQIIKESVINYEVPHNNIEFDNSLESWARQGILMLNSSLTVEVGKAGSHTMLWRPLISKLLRNLSVMNTSIIYVLFGKQAQTFKPYINSGFNHIIEIEHPAFFARTHTKMPYSVFTGINDLLYGIYGTKIEWYNET